MEQYKYYVKGTLKGTASCDNYTEDIDSHQLKVEFLDEINELFQRDPSDELAQYIHENSPIYGVVTEIWVGVRVINDDLYSWTEVTATRELTMLEKKALLDYLTGQFSDGYGEGLEQTEFHTYTETEESEEWDEEEQEYYTEEYDVDVYCYLHLWSAKGFKLELVDYSWLQYAVDDGIISESEFEIAKDIEYNINGEDIGLFIEQIKDFLKLTEIKKVSYYDIENKVFDGGYEVTLKNGTKKVFGYKFKQFGLEEILEIIPKPKCKLVGEDGNIFNLIGIASRTLQRVGLREQAAEMRKRVTSSGSYSEALSIIADYVEVM